MRINYLTIIYVYAIIISGTKGDVTMSIIQFNSASPAQLRRPLPIQISDTPFLYEAPQKKHKAAEPIKDINDIDAINEHLLSKGRYRDNLIFTMGINFGLRCGDLLKLKIGHILTASGDFQSDVILQEEKTDKIRRCFITEAVMDAAEAYFTSLQAQKIELNDYLFQSYSHNNSNKYYDVLQAKGQNVSKAEGSSITVCSVERMLKKTVNEELDIKVHASTHMLRKTFAYHFIMTYPVRERAIEMCQKILNHSSPVITMAYAGITDDEIRDACLNMSIAQSKKYQKMDFCYAAGVAK